MDVLLFATAIRRRWRLALMCLLLALAVAMLSTLFSSRVYAAKAQMFVSTSSAQSDSTTGLASGGQFAQQRVKSYAEIVNSPMVTDQVVRELRLAMSPQALSQTITASAPLDTVLIDVTVTSGSPSAAARIANAVASRFTQVVAQLETPAAGGTPSVKVSVVRLADAPTAPVSPRPKINLALGLLVGSLSGIVLSIAREKLDTTIKDAQEIHGLVGLPTLGLIGYDADAPTRPLIVQADPHSTRAEAFRQLRTNLQFVDIDSAPTSIVVTSALPQEGKSTTCCNLAIALSQAGLRVALVEADLRRPRLAEYLGLEGAVGLTDVLVGRARLDDVLQSWGENGLLVLPSGPTPPNPSELLGSQHMQALLSSLEEQVDLVLVDAPPLLPVTDAAIVAAQVSGAIVVLRAGMTTRDQLTRSIETLRAVDAKVYGVVLNMIPTKGPDANRYNYYGYGYAATKPAASEAEAAPGNAEQLLPERIEPAYRR